MEVRAGSSCRQHRTSVNCRRTGGWSLGLLAASASEQGLAPPSLRSREQPADSIGLTEHHADGQVGEAWACSQSRL